MSMTPVCHGPWPLPYVAVISSCLVASSGLLAPEKAPECGALHAFHRSLDAAHGSCTGVPTLPPHAAWSQGPPLTASVKPPSTFKSLVLQAPAGMPPPPRSLPHPPSPWNWSLLSPSVALSFPHPGSPRGQEQCLFVLLSFCPVSTLPSSFAGWRPHESVDFLLSRVRAPCAGAVSWQECGREHQKTWGQVCYVSDRGLA